MNNVLDNFDIEITSEELENQIRQYYYSLDPSIIEVTAKYSSKYVEGNWDNFWQRNLGGYIKTQVDVKIVREINVLGKNRVTKKHITLFEKELKNILSSISQKDNLEVVGIYIQYFNNKIKIKFKKI